MSINPVDRSGDVPSSPIKLTTDQQKRLNSIRNKFQSDQGEIAAAQVGLTKFQRFVSFLKGVTGKQLNVSEKRFQTVKDESKFSNYAKKQIDRLKNGVPLDRRQISDSVDAIKSWIKESKSGSDSTVLKALDGLEVTLGELEQWATPEYSSLVIAKSLIDSRLQGKVDTNGLSDAVYYLTEMSKNLKKIPTEEVRNTAQVHYDSAAEQISRKLSEYKVEHPNFDHLKEQLLNPFQIGAVFVEDPNEAKKMIEFVTIKDNFNLITNKETVGKALGDGIKLMIRCQKQVSSFKEEDKSFATICDRYENIGTLDLRLDNAINQLKQRTQINHLIAVNNLRITEYSKQIIRLKNPEKMGFIARLFTTKSANREQMDARERKIESLTSKIFRAQVAKRGMDKKRDLLLTEPLFEKTLNQLAAE